MRVTQLTVRNFRCFEQASFTFDAPVVLIQGDNGSGKTTLLEALYYACYVRSFRTHKPRDLVRHGSDGCYAQVTFVDQDQCSHVLQVGVQAHKRRVKLDDKAVRSYGELMGCMRMVTVTDNDAQLVRGGPEQRRSFIDEYVVMHEPAFFEVLKRYMTAVSQRNALLRQPIDETNFEVWSRRVFEQALIIMDKRAQYVDCLGGLLKRLCVKKEWLLDLSLTYQTRKSLRGTFEEFLPTLRSLRAAEQALGYTLFGAHLDDIVIQSNGTLSRTFASRGQQKGVSLLLKIAQAYDLAERYGGGVVLLDDVMLDFDDHTLKLFIELLVQLPMQLIFTSAQGASGALQRVLSLYSPQVMHLDKGAFYGFNDSNLAKNGLIPTI